MTALEAAAVDVWHYLLDRRRSPEHIQHKLAVEYPDLDSHDILLETFFGLNRLHPLHRQARRNVPHYPQEQPYFVATFLTTHFLQDNDLFEAWQRFFTRHPLLLSQAPTVLQTFYECDALEEATFRAWYANQPLTSPFCRTLEPLILWFQDA